MTTPLYIPRTYSPHPLDQSEILPPYRWTEWLERWEGTSDLFSRLGLLHNAFDVYESEEGGLRRLNFLLEMADGWGDVGYAYDDHPHTLIREKALEVVAFNFFATPKSHGNVKVTRSRWGWEDAVRNPSVVKLLAWFFRPGVGHFHVRTVNTADNLPDKYQKGRVYDITREFAGTIACLAFGFGRERWLGVGEHHDWEAFIPHQPEFAHLLLATGYGHLLLNSKAQITAKVRARLREIAMDQRYQGGTDSGKGEPIPFPSLREALCHDSQAAEILYFLETAGR